MCTNLLPVSLLVQKSMKISFDEEIVVKLVVNILIVVDGFQKEHYTK